MQFSSFETRAVHLIIHHKQSINNFVFEKPDSRVP